MASVEANAPAAFETTVFLDYFKDTPNRWQAGNVAYRLDDAPLLTLVATLAGAEVLTDIARFGQKRLDLLLRFLPFANGAPSYDLLGDIFASLDPDAFRRCFVSWVAGLTKAAPEVIAIDGKTSRRSGRKGAKDAIHTVNCAEFPGGILVRVTRGLRETRLGHSNAFEPRREAYVLWVRAGGDC